MSEQGVPVRSEPGGFRERLRGDVDSIYDDLWATYRAALQATKGYPRTSAPSATAGTGGSLRRPTGRPG
jgi:hypothetical protein